MRSLIALGLLAALIANVAAQLAGTAQSAVNAAYQSVVRALDGQSTTVSFARVQSASAATSGALVTSSVPNPNVRRRHQRTTDLAGRRDLYHHDVRSICRLGLTAQRVVRI